MSPEHPRFHPASFLILDPEGNSSRQELRAFPFRIGRQSDNDLRISDPRASRHHAELTAADGDFVLQDLESRHGLFVNGDRVRTHVLRHEDRITFGSVDSYTLVFEKPGLRFLETSPDTTHGSDRGGTLGKLRAVLEVGRALQNSFSVDTVLNAVVDAALVITNAERGFLLLKQGGELQVRCARDRSGGPLRESDLRVPRSLIRKALENRAATFSMQFDPSAASDPGSTVFVLELRSVVCIPLVRIQMGSSPEDVDAAASGETAGVLYMDSRRDARDLAAGNRELLETLAIEASTVLENARLLDEERRRQHIDEELKVARGIQQALLPPELPEIGWLRAAGYSQPSRQVGGDYYDVLPLTPACWAAVVADVAGKGVSSALVASLLQGAFLAMDESPESMLRTLMHVNRFFTERAEGGKHATLFCGLINQDGHLSYVNAGHCAPILAPLNGPITLLPATSMPVGLFADATYHIEQRRLVVGDRLVLYSDGITEAHNSDHEFYGLRRLKAVIRAHADRPCAMLHAAILAGVEEFTGGREQNDDLTLVVLEYHPD